MTQDDKVTCRTPNADGTTRLPRWKYDCVRRAILEAIDASGPDGLPFSELPDAVKKRLRKSELEKLGSVGWHVTSVKLELEVAGEILRIPGQTPQRLLRAEQD